MASGTGASAPRPGADGDGDSHRSAPRWRAAANRAARCRTGRQRERSPSERSRRTADTLHRLPHRRPALTGRINCSSGGPHSQRHQLPPLWRAASAGPHQLPHGRWLHQRVSSTAALAGCISVPHQPPHGRTASAGRINCRTGRPHRATTFPPPVIDPALAPRPPAPPRCALPLCAPLRAAAQSTAAYYSEAIHEIHCCTSARTCCALQSASSARGQTNTLVASSYWIGRL